MFGNNGVFLLQIDATFCIGPSVASWTRLWSLPPSRAFCRSWIRGSTVKLYLCLRLSLPRDIGFLHLYSLFLRQSHLHTSGVLRNEMDIIPLGRNPIENAWFTAITGFVNIFKCYRATHKPLLLFNWKEMNCSFLPSFTRLVLKGIFSINCIPIARSLATTYPSNILIFRRVFCTFR